MFIGGPEGPTPVGCVILVIAVTNASNWVTKLSTSTDQFGVANLISFLDANINDRKDIYGGTIENRIRFAIELLDSLIKNIGNEKIMVRISPSRFMGGLYEWPDMMNVLKKLLKEFDYYGLRQLDISCANSNYFETSGKVIKLIKKQWPHLLIGGASLTITEAENEITEGNLDMITWGRAILANPDFVKLVKKGLSLKDFDNIMRESLIWYE